MKSLPLIFWVVLVGVIGVKTQQLKCHRCVYTDPYDETIAKAIKLAQLSALDLGYNFPDWTQGCRQSPSHDLGDPQALPNIPRKKQVLQAFISMVSRLVEKDQDEVNLMLRHHEGQVAAYVDPESLFENKASASYCFEGNVMLDFNTTQVTLIYREGLILDLGDENGNKCYQGVDPIVEVIGEDPGKEIRGAILDLSACLCNTGQGCNSKGFNDTNRLMGLWVLISMGSLVAIFY